MNQTSEITVSVLRNGFFTLEPPRIMQADGYPWAHEFRVALPFSYGETTRNYPVLWVTDNALESAVSVLSGSELIIVAVGATGPTPVEALGRRAYDFYPDPDIYAVGPLGDSYRRADAGRRDDSGPKGGGAKRFLDFLVDEVRPVLASEYRMADDHGLTGFSAGGWFVTYALLTRPDSFARYIGGAPSLAFSNGLLFELEEKYAAEHDDMPVDLFFGAGDGEMTVDASLEILSSMVKMVERLSFRRYPSLRMTVRIFPGETHATASHAVIGWGARSVWGDAIKPETSPFLRAKR